MDLQGLYLSIVTLHYLPYGSPNNSCAESWGDAKVGLDEAENPLR